MKGMIFSIEEFAIHDGPGIRANVFFKGCPLRCRWCHNPEGLSVKRQILHSPNGCLGCGACKAACTSPEACTLCGSCILACPRGLIRYGGEEWEAEDLAARILRLKPILENGGGVTFSGGEILLQPDFLCEMLDRTASLHRAVETCGHGREEDFARMLQRVELVYMDLKVMDPAAHKHYTGVDNALILKNARTLMQSGVPYVFRVPFIRGVNTGKENLTALAEFLAEAPSAPAVELLLYNTMAGAKYPLVGRRYEEVFERPTAEELEEAKSILADFDVKIKQ